MGRPTEFDAPRATRPRIAVYIALAFAVSTSWHFYRRSVHELHGLRPTVRVASAEAFDWYKLPPSATLEWVSCYEEPFQCARLEVPLDYGKPHGQKAAVAMIKYPSKYPVGHENWRGPILYNPGGPGGSGVDMVRGEGANLSSIIGDDFDHIGFDPRGIGRTTPQLTVLPSAAERFAWQLQQPASINGTTDALGKIHGYAKIMGELVQERQAHVAAHMSTAIVSRDMLQITRAHGREKLLYWGFSYGTVLGITFSAMFPNNVGRVIVDGVADTENYYEAAWSNNLLDADKNFAAVLASCAGSSACPLRETTGALVGTRVNRILDSLRTDPLPINNGTNYGIVDFDVARVVVFRGLYGPYKSFGSIFAALAAAERGDGVPLYNLFRRPSSLWRCNCDNPALPESVGETTMAVACGDGDVVRDSLSELRQFYARMAETSSFADMWDAHVLCTGWKIRPVERYNGPFVGNTSHPLLFIGNTADPVTPLWAAKKMSKGFKDAVVLTQNSLGHCSSAGTSLCTTRYIRAYFRDGTLPAPGTVCEVEDEVFPQDQKADNITVEVLSTEEAKLLQAARDFSTSFNIPLFGQI